MSSANTKEMSSANTKVYKCSFCRDKINYNRKQFFKHIKTPDHIETVNNKKQDSKISSDTKYMEGSGRRTFKDYKEVKNIKRILALHKQQRAVQEE